MPKSRVRSKAVYTPPKRSAKAQVSPRWLVPTMVGSWIIGLAWIAIYYVLAATSSSVAPWKDLGTWNLGIGFALIIFGVVLSTKWR